MFVHAFRHAGHKTFYITLLYVSLLDHQSKNPFAFYTPQGTITKKEHASFCFLFKLFACINFCCAIEEQHIVREALN